MHVRKHRLSNQFRALCRFNSEKVCAIYKYLVNSRTLTMKSIKIFNRSIQLLNVVFGTHILYRRLRCRDRRICSVKEKQYVLFTIVIKSSSWTCFLGFIIWTSSKLHICNCLYLRQTNIFASDTLSTGCVWLWWDKDDGCPTEAARCCAIALCFVLGIGVVGCRPHTKRPCRGGWHCTGCSRHYPGKLHLSQWQGLPKTSSLRTI